MNWGDIITAAIAGGLVVKVLDLIFGRKRDKAEITKMITEAAEKMIKSLTDRVTTLEKELRTVKRKLERYAERVIYLMNGIQTLIKQIEEKKEVPCWKPDEWDPDEEGDDGVSG